MTALLFLSVAGAVLSVVSAAPAIVASPPTASCNIVFDGRVPQNLALADFDKNTSSPFSPDFVRAKGEND